MRCRKNLDEGMIGGGEGGQFIEGWIDEVAGEGEVGLKVVAYERESPRRNDEQLHCWCS